MVSVMAQLWVRIVYSIDIIHAPTACHIWKKRSGELTNTSLTIPPIFSLLTTHTLLACVRVIVHEWRTARDPQEST